MWPRWSFFQAAVGTIKGVRSWGQPAGWGCQGHSDAFCPLQVNAIDLREASHDEAINVLRQTPQRVRLLVYRDQAQYREEELWDSFSVELQRRPGQGLGLSIVGRRWEGASGTPASALLPDVTTSLFSLTQISGSEVITRTSRER